MSRRPSFLLVVLIAAFAAMLVGGKCSTGGGDSDCFGDCANVALTALDGNIDADTPDGGLGTTIAVGAVVVLGGTAAFENVLTGQTFDNCTGTAEVESVATNLAIQAADSHVLFFNVADGWAASGEAACPIGGTVTVLWTQLA